jgi:hypothetical protein
LVVQVVTKDDVAARLSPDLVPWERQPGEPEAAWQGFSSYLHSEKRRVGEHGPSARNWSSLWHWAHRAHEYDIYMARIDLEDQVRYRRKMNERHRRMAAVAQSKVVAWLNELDDAKVAKMSVADATRLWDVAVRIEQAATCAVSAAEDLPDPYSEPARKNGLEQRFIDAGVDEEKMPELARLLHELETLVSVSEPPPPADDRPAPLEPPQDRVERPTEEARHGGRSPDIWGKAVDEPTQDIFGAG